MKRCCIFLVMVVFGSGLADAQLINYKRRQEYQKQNQDTSAESQAVEMKKEAQVQRKDREGSSTIKIKSRSERVYDQNADGLLQQNELKKLFADVVASVEQWGQFKVNSDILKSFDEDEDGQISFHEVQSIRDQLDLN